MRGGGKTRNLKTGRRKPYMVILILKRYVHLGRGLTFACFQADGQVCFFSDRFHIAVIMGASMSAFSFSYPVRYPIRTRC